MGKDLKICVQQSDMAEEQKEFALKTISSNFEHQGPLMSNELLAYKIREAMEGKYGDNTWQCVAGKDYAVQIDPEPGSLLFVYADQVAILVFKAR